MRIPPRARRPAAWATGALALVALAVIAFVVRGGGPVPVAASTTTVQRGTVTLDVSAAGTVQSAQTRGLAFAVAGTVTELNVKAGDLVTAGQVLARIDPTDAQAAVDAASARVDDAQNALTKAEQTAALPPCPSPTPRPTAAPSGSASPAPSASPTPRQTQPAPATGNPSPTCTNPNRNSTSDALLSAQQNLNNAKLALNQANLRLAGTTITAPVAGRVLSVGGKVGSRATAGGTGFIVLGEVATLIVQADFTEADVGRLAVGQPAMISLPDRTDQFSGKVSQIDPAGTVSNRLVRYGVLIAFDKVPADPLLGESATVTVTTASAENVLYVSTAAIVGVANGAGTVTVRANNRDEVRNVTVGLRGDQYTEVGSGLTEGDVVVLPSSA